MAPYLRMRWRENGIGLTPEWWEIHQLETVSMYPDNVTAICGWEFERVQVTLIFA